MAMLILDCPRCGERKMTQDWIAHTQYTDDGQRRHELTLQCRHCNKSSIWLVVGQPGSPPVASLGKTNAVINDHLFVFGFVRPTGSSVKAPEFTPPDIIKIFDEGAECLAIGCWNASGSMFRKIVDEISKARLPKEGEPDKHTRWNLKPRLAWLFNNNLLPKEVESLADCIREDANDAVHNAPIGQGEATDLLDFTVELLERIYTMPGRLKAAEERRVARREATK
jgi:Domain of unknown function (DUF4145)